MGERGLGSSTRDFSEHVHELARFVGERRPWAFIVRDEAGELKVFSNQRPEQIREMLRRYATGRS